MTSEPVCELLDPEEMRLLFEMERGKNPPLTKSQMVVLDLLCRSLYQRSGWCSAAWFAQNYSLAYSQRMGELRVLGAVTEKERMPNSAQYRYRLLNARTFVRKLYADWKKEQAA